jgi:hypothetical protein
MLNIGAAVVNHFFAESLGKRPIFHLRRDMCDIVKVYTSSVLTFHFAVGQYPHDRFPEAAMLPGDPRDVRRYFAFSQVGMEMVAPTVAGIMVDLWLHWLPWCTLIGVVLGLVVGFAHLIYLVNKDDSDSSPPKPSQRESR